MPSLFNHYYINRMVCSTLLTAFSLTYAIPAQAYIRQDTYQVGINDVVTMVRLEKIIEKLINSKDKGTDKIIGYLADVRNEIESSYQVKFDLDQCMNTLSQDFSNTGNKVSKKELEVIKKKLTKKDKKKKGRSWYFASMLGVDGYEFDDFNEDDFYPIMKGSKKDKDKQEDEVVMPAHVVYGVSVALCGLFLMVLPIPMCKEWGSKIFMMGAAACANGICNRVEEDRKKENEKKK